MKIDPELIKPLVHETRAFETSSGRVFRTTEEAEMDELSERLFTLLNRNVSECIRPQLKFFCKDIIKNRELIIALLSLMPLASSK